MGRIASLTVVAVVATGAGCLWVQPGAGPDRTAHNPFEDAVTVDTAGALTEVWDAPLDEGPAGDPLVSAEGVHVAGPRSVYGFGAVDGARAWEHEVAAPLAVQQPLVVGDQVVVNRWNPTATPTTDPGVSDTFVVVDAATGVEERAEASGVVVSARGRDILTWETGFIRLGLPQFPFWSEVLSVRDLDTGVARCCNAAFYGLGGSSGPPPAPERFTLGRTWLLQAGMGQLDPDTPSVPVNGIRGYLVDDNRTCLGLYNCADWALPLDGTAATHPVLHDDQATAYVGTDAGTVVAVDVTTSPATVRWSVPVGAAVTDAPALDGDGLFVPTAAGELVALDAATGAERWRTAVGAPVEQQPAVAGGLVFAGAADGGVHALDAATGEPLWSASVGAAVTGAPAVAGGQVYVGTADGRLVAFGLR